MPGTSHKTQVKSNKTPTFEAALTELEQVVAEMEAGQLPLEGSLAAYKRGAELLQQCRARLEDAQQQVRILEEGTLKNFADNFSAAGNACPELGRRAAKRDDA